MGSKGCFNFNFDFGSEIRESRAVSEWAARQAGLFISESEDIMGRWWYGNPESQACSGQGLDR